MATRQVEGTTAAGYVADVVPEIVADLASEALGSREAVEGEVDLMSRTVREFWSWEPDQVMRTVAAFSARCTELAINLHRVEGRLREWKQVRTKQVEPLLKELERQYTIASRLVEIRRQDLNYLNGM